MNCRSAESLFSALLEDELNQRERRSLEAHLMGCRRCSVGLREFRASLQLLQETPLELETSPHFEEDVMARIRSGEGLRPSMIEWLRALWTPAASPSPSIIRPLAFGGVAASVIALSLVFHQPVSDFVLHLAGSETKTAGQVARMVVPAPSPSSNEATGVSGAEQPAIASVSGRPVGATAQPPSAAARTGRGEGGSASAPAGMGTTDSWPSDLATVPVESSQEEAPSIPNPDSRYIDEYITDQFYLDRGLGGSPNPSITPVSGRSSDDVYIVF